MKIFWRAVAFFCVATCVTIALLAVMTCIVVVSMGGNPFFFFSVAFLIFVTLVTVLCLLVEGNFQRDAERAQ